MSWAHRNVTETAGMQNTADRALTKSDAVFVHDDALQVLTAPLHDAIGLDAGTRLDDPMQRLELVRLHPRWTPAPRPVHETGRTLGNEPVNPVAR